MGKSFWSSGEPFIWGTGAVLAIILFLMFGLVGVVFFNAVTVFWPSELVSIEMKDGRKYLGEYCKREKVGT